MLMVPKVKTKDYKFTERRKKRVENQNKDKEFEKYSEIEKKVLKSRKELYTQVLSRFQRKDLDTLYDILECEYLWSTLSYPKGKQGDKVFTIALHFIRYKKIFLCLFEDIPLYIGDQATGDKIISWRFKIKV